MLPLKVQASLPDDGWEITDSWFRIEETERGRHIHIKRGWSADSASRYRYAPLMEVHIHIEGWWSTESSGGNENASGGGNTGGSFSVGSNFQYESASTIDEIIEICKKYADRGTVTGVRNQIDWMKQLYSSASQDFVGHLGMGEVLLISALNHSSINITLISKNMTRMTPSYTAGDFNREISKRIAEGADGYIDVDAIAKATGLKAEDVRSILERIASGSITENTIAVGKKRSQATNRGAYAQQQAQKQEAVWKYLIAEIDRMTTDPASLEILCQDLGTGYVANMLSGQELDVYKVSLYKKYLAQTLDSVLESDSPYSVITYEIGKSDAYKVTKKTRSALSGLFNYEAGAKKDALSEELKAFLDEHLKNGILSESEAREYLILSGQYQEGEYGIGEAAKQVVKGYKHLKGLKTVLDKTGEAFDVIEKAKKAEEYIDYWATDYAEQELLLDALVENLSASGSDMDLMAAARELRQEYENKLTGTLNKVYTTLIEQGIGTIKSTFPPLGIAETTVSLLGTITGADKRVSALETGLAMQGICQQALKDYENAVIAVSKGDSSEAAVSRVLTTFETARHSLISYYEAMVELEETDSQKGVYSFELERLKKANFGYATVSLPFGFGNAGGR